MAVVDIDALSPSEKVVAGAGIVLVVDLVFLPWRSIDLGITTSTRSAVEPAGAWLGILAVVLTVAVVAATLLRALGREHVLPDLPVSWPVAVAAGAAATLAVLVAKLGLGTDALGIGAWLALALAAAMTAGAVAGTRPHVAE